jgi:hypothetical protein
VRVRNFCPFSLWVHAAGHSGESTVVLEPDDQEVPNGGAIDYPTPAPWDAARVTAYKGGPRNGGGVEIEKAEMTLGGANAVLNYNITYVDWVGLPVEIVGVGEGCSPGIHVTGCWTPVADILEGCPHPALEDQDRCLAPRSFCMNPANHEHELCRWLDPAIEACVEQGLGCPAMNGNPDETGTPAVYGCNAGSWYGANEVMCAALNRGMLESPESADTRQYYQNEPYNMYSAWSHSVCPGVYSFSYDDVHAQGGFRACSGDEIRVTFCPGDAPLDL